MMDLTGSSQIIATIQQPGDSLSMSLKVNQKITATILSLMDGRAVLSVKGVKVNAQLSTPEQMALLANMRQAQFFVKDISKNAVQLQLIPPKTASQKELASAVLPNRLTELSKSLLSQFGLPRDETHILLTQSLLERGMDVTPEIIKELQQALTNLVKWSPKELQTAVQMKMAGLPVSPGTINLLNQAGPELTEGLINLREQLQQLITSSNAEGSQNPLPAQAKALASNVLSQLDNLILQWSNTTQGLQNGIQKAIELVSRSLEKDLADLVMKGQTQENINGSESLMLSLAMLRASSNQHGMPELTRSIDQFMGHLRSLQFVNSPTQSESAQGHWLQMDIPLQFMTGTGDFQNSEPRPLQEYNQTHLKIACRQGKKGKGREVDPNYTRLVIQVDIQPGETLDVDLSIVNQKIGALFTASSDHIKEFAEEELPGLQDGLNGVGYVLETSRFVVGDKSSSLRETAAEQGLVTSQINNRFDLEI